MLTTMTMTRLMELTDIDQETVELFDLSYTDLLNLFNDLNSNPWSN